MSAKKVDRLSTPKSKKLGGLVFPLYLILAIGAMVFPSANHILDNADQSILAQELIDGKKIITRNITITDARVLKKYYEKRVVIGRSYGSPQRESYVYKFAIVPKAYKDGDPIHIIFNTSDPDIYKVSDILKQTNFSGVIRNIWWEGVSDSTVDYFQNDLGYPLSKDVYLLDNDDNGGDLLLVSIMFGALLFILLVFGSVAWSRKKVK